ncbi:lambda exonuclease family protein [Brachybacterium sp. AOP3-A1-3]|uniref:lambda exonuclease family protein n=1 Tax=Brachybacterium sp. AOP3-A1-3 TaxID=3457699 RepID=UPI0040349A96
MTLTVYKELEQGSEAWLQARAGILTASVVGQLITPSKVQLSKSDTARAVMENLLAERIAGHVDEFPMTADMERGTLDEPYARDLYAEHTGQKIDEIGFAVYEDPLGRRLGYSPDGMIGDDGLLEIKSRKPKIHLRTWLDDTVPAANMAQLQCGLYVTGRAWIDYVSYAGGWPLYIKRVTADPHWQDAIQDALIAYETFADLMTETYKTRTEGAPIAPRIDHWAEQEMTF